ncbi:MULTISPECIES: tyrosine-type recombinase/integrase [Bacteroides]|uniref:Recombinase n=1 Tax=Bacteroides fragilis TaxID=817 RepID=A0A0I9SCZ3_BACFG|nr:phage integrase SAM-like domain-containing protein [Bacteroides fragilis]MCM0196007.1 site-specific integrase [Bacteroides fragilis]MCM0201061.1 site-specific integrase [Bacteroides fragilis]MCM0211632.1 site-specific integrase [Bacteroides fragilis]MCM0216231.1 site-specific integrase [Bacteroides fragilis]MCM0226887.1 site-specific integrase [Bacteroides fragilis]
MANLFITIVPTKKMLNGKHKVRIAVSHNLATRYIPTNIIIDAENEFKNGKVVKRPDKDILNARLKKIYDMYYERCMKIEYANTLTCTQLIKMITKPITGERNRKFEDIVEEFLSQIDEEDRTKTYKLYKLAANRFLQFTGPNSLMEHITPVRINNYLNSLKREKLSGTTINIYTTLLKVMINYAIKMRYVEYKVDPFVTAKIPSSRKRDTYITVEQLKKIRDMEPRKYNESVVRDIFMLTYYLAGMNLVDMLAYDFRTDEISYVRTKTRNTKDGDHITSFTIPEEAKPIIKKYMNKNTGRIVFGKYKTYVSCYNTLTRKLDTLKKIADIKHDFTLYSARKSFVQHGFDLGIPLSTLEYCIGQSMKEDRPIFNYVTIMKKHADKAIREILDNLK